MEINSVFQDVCDDRQAIADKMAQLKIPIILAQDKCDFLMLVKHIRLFDWCGDDEAHRSYIKTFIEKYW